MECPRCLLSDDIQGVKIGKKQCNYCDLHDSLEKEYPISRLYLNKMVKKIKERGKKFKYDCLIGISGGSDSSYLLHWAKVNDLRVLAFHFDNGFNKDFAERNMTKMLEATGFDCIRFRINPKEYNELNHAFLRASVSDCDIPNDIAMGSLMLDFAMKYKVKTIINGHNFRTEGSCPIGWTYMDSEYISDVYHRFVGKRLHNYPNLSIWQQIKASLMGIHHERPFYHMKDSKVENRKVLKLLYGWEDYQGWHCENKYTQFAGYVANAKFGIDKRRVELSAKIRSYEINKKTAQLILEQTTPEPTEVINEIVERVGIFDFNRIMQEPRRMYTDFKNNKLKFKKYKWLIWLGYKMHFLPKTFYVKYTK